MRIDIGLAAKLVDLERSVAGLDRSTKEQLRK
jgi:hypothetical protein